MCLVFVFSVKGPELINMYVGQSEENIREGKSNQINYSSQSSDPYELISTIFIVLSLLTLPSLHQCSVRPELLLPVLFSLMSWTHWLLIEATVETQEG